MGVGEVTKGLEATSMTGDFTAFMTESVFRHFHD